jgi:hypothetical protein
MGLMPADETGPVADGPTAGSSVADGPLSEMPLPEGPLSGGLLDRLGGRPASAEPG